MRTETFPTPRPLTLNLKLPRGTLEVVTDDVAETTVELKGTTERARDQIERTEIRLENRGDYDELIVDSDPEDFGWRKGRFAISISFDRRDDVGIKVTAPHGASLEATTGAGAIRARGRYGEVQAKTGSGDVSVDEVERDAAIKVASGDVKVQSVGGSLKVQTAAGDVESGPVAGKAEVKTAAGDVSLDEVGDAVSVNSASGNLRVGAVTQGAVELKSVSGDMLVGIRRGSRVWMDVKTVTGDASSELDSGADDDGEGPLVELKATAMSGDIRIVRA
jgi:DUF4097 and DUF4098 domain-containing protein YvlB